MTITIRYVWLGVMLFFVAFCVVWLIFPTLLKMARVWKCYDNPDARKLQRQPVPVLGGVAVYLGILLGISILLTISYDIVVLMMMLAMSVLLVVGVFDDRKNLSPFLRFIIEIGVVTMLVLFNGNMIDSFHGLWGVWTLPAWAAYALSILAGVGLINAINLIDGVDGYSSGFICITCLLFGIVFYAARISCLAIICLIVVGAVIPFFIHNVFGRKTKMFIGDGGTLMLGTLITALVFSILKEDSACRSLEDTGFGLIPFCLAVLSVPVFDTLRVMFWRMLKGISPFKPDKTHLHHLFIDLGFSHIGATIIILLANCLVVVAQLAAWKCGASMEVQLYIVIATGLLVTTVFYIYMRIQMMHNTQLYKTALQLGKMSHIENSKFWNFMKKVADNELFIQGN